jgi:hypothetical protein
MYNKKFAESLSPSKLDTDLDLEEFEVKARKD